ncbi:MAG: restriction endonuclease subunit S, partial [Lachnospiraceae bacterium]
MTAQELKNAILMRAVQGKLVPQDPNDEPASALLEKIRAEKEQLMKDKKIKKEPISIIYKDPSDNQHYRKDTDGTEKCIDE